MLQNFITALIGKKKLIGYVSAGLLAIAGLFLGFSSQEMKDMVCAAPVVEVPQEIKDKVDAVKGEVAPAPVAAPAK
jgi:hypothetical protein